jgi:hypothetical protein
LRTNAGLECAFRCNLEDAKPLVQAMPLPVDAQRLEATRQAMVQELLRLPDREYLLWMKRMSFGAQRVRSPRLDLEGFRSAVEGLSEEVRSAIRRGTVSMDRVRLEALLAAEGEALNQTATEGNRPTIRSPKGSKLG